MKEKDKSRDQKSRELKKNFRVIINIIKEIREDIKSMKQCLKKDQPQETNNQAMDIQQRVPSIMNGKKIHIHIRVYHHDISKHQEKKKF